MTATALYTLLAAGAVLGGYALYRRETEHPHPTKTGFATGWDHTTVDYQNPADAVTDQRYERNFFNRPYQIFCPGGEIRPYEIDAHGQPTGRQLVMPGESPTGGNPAEYVMVGWHPHGEWGHHHHHHHDRLHRWEMEQAALAEAQAEAEALAADPSSMAAMGDFMTGLTPAQIAMLRARRHGMLGFGGGGGWRQQQMQQQLMQQQMLQEQLQQQIADAQQAASDALAAQQLAATQAQTEALAAQAAATATTGDYATGAYNPYAMWRMRRMMGMGGMGGGRQQQLQQQLLQQQMLNQQLAQQAADAALAQQQAEMLAAQSATPDLGLGAGV